VVSEHPIAAGAAGADGPAGLPASSALAGGRRGGWDCRGLLRQHRLAAWLAPHVLHWIGAANADRSAAAEKLLASLPMVTFRPSGESKVDDLDEEGESNPGSTGSSR